MDYIEHIKQESINEFGSETTQKRYSDIAEFGLWESEKNFNCYQSPIFYVCKK
jgi:hypothetical protein